MISVRGFDSPAWNIREVLRYARANDDDSTAVLVRECISEAEQVLTYKACYTVLELERTDGGIAFGPSVSASQTLVKAVKGCEKALLFAVTVGAGLDRLIMRYSRISPSKAVILHAIGAERAEALCDALMKAVSDETGYSLRPRVSPGYGDMPLTMQKDIFALLDCPRKIGLTLNESLIMSPSKSVTAIAGIGRSTGCYEADGCYACDKTDCIYRV